MKLLAYREGRGFWGSLRLNRGGGAEAWFAGEARFNPHVLCLTACGFPQIVRWNQPAYHVTPIAPNGQTELHCVA